MEIRSASWLEFFVFSGRSLIAAIIYIREVTCNHFSSKLRVKAVSHTWSKHKQKILSASSSQNDLSHFNYPTIFITNCASHKISKSDSVPLKNINLVYLRSWNYNLQMTKF